MNFQEFVAYVQENIKDYMPERYRECRVSVDAYMKEGVQVHGLTIKAGGTVEMVPTISMEHFYEMHQKGKSVQSVLVDIAVAYDREMEQIKAVGMPDFQTPKDLEQYILDHLFVAVYPLDRIEAVGNIPYLQLNDLAVVAKSKMTDHGTITMTSENIEKFGLDSDTVLAMAMKNQVPGREMKFSSIADLIGIPAMGGENMYVLTTEDNFLGAGLITDKALLHQISQQLDSNLIILPSSIHEILILKEDQQRINLTEMKQMVEDINRSCLDPKDILSNNVYRFDRNSLQLEYFDGAIRPEFAQYQDKKPKAPKLA